jgi:FKBP-type peptidyl-prolyl cis-trans isomerase
MSSRLIISFLGCMGLVHSIAFASDGVASLLTDTKECHVPTVFSEQSHPSLAAWTESDKNSYCYGWRMAGGYREAGFNLDPHVFLASFRAKMAGRTCIMNSSNLVMFQSVGHRTANPERAYTKKLTDLPKEIDLDVPVPLNEESQAIAYAYGQIEAQTFLKLKHDLSARSFTWGVLHGWFGEAPLIAEAEMITILAGVDQAIDMAKKGQNSQAYELGTKFHQDYRQKKEVVPLPSGVSYLLKKEGKGEMPDRNDAVRIHYRMKKVDGSLIEQTPPKESAPEIPMPALPKGLQEVLEKIKVGSAVEVVIPSELAFGENWEAHLPGRSTVIYELELEGLKRYPGQTP